MHQEEFWRDSRSFLGRPRISWISTRTWSNWRSLYPDGQGRAERFHLSNDARRVQRIGGSLSINLKKIGPTGDRSDFNDALTTLTRLHQESGERPLRPVPFWKYQQWHSSSSSSSSSWQWNDSWWSSWQLTSSPLSSCKKRHDRTGRPVVCRLFTKPEKCRLWRFFRFVAVRSFTADNSLLQPTGGVKTTPHTVLFSQ